MGMSYKSFVSILLNRKKLDSEVSDNYWSINNNIYFTLDRKRYVFKDRFIFQFFV